MQIKFCNVPKSSMGILSMGVYVTQIYQVDSFTNQRFFGNPAGVCVLDAPQPEEWMQNIAMEMSLSETAFVVREEGKFHIRWFTPTCEVDLCGHATLAAAHIIFGQDSNQHKLEFRSKSGPLMAIKEGEWITLDFPANPPTPCEDTIPFKDILNTTPVAVLRNSFAYVVELTDAQSVRQLMPDMSRIAKLDAEGLLVTAKGDQKFDFVSRCFFPKLGIPEDPVTGAAHCALGPYWAGRLHQNSFLAQQASARSGELKVELNKDRVMLSGQAVTTMNIKLLD